MSVISANERPKKHIRVLDKRMAFVELGSGDPTFVFLHGNPTSSYLWRNIMPAVQDLGHCFAPDLIGMGDSDKLDDSSPGRYTFVEHRRYLDGLLDALNVRDNIILVVHDWGSALGFDWARRHPTAIRGICYMEAIVRPMSWDEWPDSIQALFQGFRSEQGEAMVLEKNIFVERVLPGSVLRQLSEAEMAVYRRPFASSGEARRPTLTWPRQIPLGDEPTEVVEIVQAYADWLSQDRMPKLFINAEPGAILTAAMREFCRSWPNQTEVTVAGSHFIQEDSPAEIGTALREWVAAVLQESK